MVRRGAAVLAVALCVLSGCGDGDDAQPAADGPEPAVVEVTTRELQRKKPGDDQVAIRATPTVPAGLVEVRFENAGRFPHDAQLVRVDGKRKLGRVIEAVILFAQEEPLPDWLHGAGGVGVLEGGQRGRATQVLEPGTYYVVDTESTGEAGEVNVQQGGIRKLRVTGRAPATTAQDDLPEADASITAEDLGIEASGLKAGRNRISFENAGRRQHRIRAIPLSDAADSHQVEELFAIDAIPALEGVSPLRSEGLAGTALLAGGGRQVADLRLEPGRYVLVCFVADRPGLPHSAQGMIEEVDVE